MRPWEKYTNRYVRKRTFSPPRQTVLNQHAHLCSLISHRCLYDETFRPWLSNMCPVKILIRLRECAVWSESSLGARVLRYFSAVAANICTVWFQYFENILRVGGVWTWLIIILFSSPHINTYWMCLASVIETTHWQSASMICERWRIKCKRLTEVFEQEVVDSE